RPQEGQGVRVEGARVLLGERVEGARVGAHGGGHRGPHLEDGPFAQVAAAHAAAARDAEKSAATVRDRSLPNQPHPDASRDTVRRPRPDSASAVASATAGSDGAPSSVTATATAPSQRAISTVKAPPGWPDLVCRSAFTTSSSTVRSTSSS